MDLFASCINNTANTFVANSQVFGKVYFPRLTMPISQVLTSLINFAIQAAMYVIFWLYFWATGAEMHLTAWMWALPVVIVQVMLLGLGVGIIVSSLTTKYRDLAIAVSFGVQLWMYVSPWSTRCPPWATARALPFDAPEPHDRPGGDLPHRHAGHRLGGHGHVHLQPGVHGGGAVYRRDFVQPH